ncbi:MAG: class I SAM-dependent methyltransferase [Gemmataceae bacterium]
MRVASHFLLWSLGLSKATTQTTDAERECLARHASGREKLAEIGVWHGVTTCVLRGVMASHGVLYAVDPYPVGRLGFSFQRIIARREVRRVPNGELVWMRLTGAEAAKKIAEDGLGPVDLVFIDGDHTYEGLRQDWEGWSPLVCPGGTVALHDSMPTPDRDIESIGSVRYTREIVSKDPRFERVEVVDSLSVFQRREDV